jgi:hypothetical protein
MFIKFLTYTSHYTKFCRDTNKIYFPFVRNSSSMNNEGKYVNKHNAGYLINIFVRNLSTHYGNMQLHISGKNWAGFNPGAFYRCAF